MPTTRLVIPHASTTPDFVQVTDVGARLYRLRLRFNRRDNAWFLDVLTEAGAQIIMGRKLRVRWNVLDQFVDERLPLGNLGVPNLDGLNLEPRRNDLGDRLFVMYREET